VATVGTLLISWQDPLLDTSALHSHYFLHVPSWGSYIPGWGHYTGIEVQPLFIRFGYVLMMLPVIVTCLLTERVARAPREWGARRIFAVATGFGIVTMALVEQVVIRGGGYSWVGGIQEFSVPPGDWQQLPLLEVVILSIVFIAPLALMRRTVRAGDLPHVFRGAPAITGYYRTTLRFLALLGFMNLTLLVWMLSQIAMATHGDLVTDVPAWFKP
jgi:hypothetical protein